MFAGSEPFPGISSWVLPPLIRSIAVKKERTKTSFHVTTSTAIASDTTFALAAVETILKDASRETPRAALALNLRQLKMPLEAMMTVPVDVHVSAGDARNEWRLRICAASDPFLYPTFSGVLALIPACGQGCQLQLDGDYTPPFGALGRLIDATLLRGVAQSSLERFVREVGYRVAAVAQWVTPRSL